MQNKEKVLLWLDDVRDPHQNNWLRYSPIPKPFNVVWVKRYRDFISHIEENGLPDAICFDHDIEDFHISKSTYKEKTGYDCAKWLVDYCLDTEEELPLYNIQSSNTAGKENIDKLLQNYNEYNRKNK